MATGLEMLLKSFGINPAEIQKAMTDTITNLQSGIAAIDHRLTEIRDQNAALAARLERLEDHLGVPSEANLVAEIIEPKRFVG